MPNRNEPEPPAPPETPQAPPAQPPETPAQRDARLEILDKLGAKSDQELKNMIALAQRGLETVEAERKAKEAKRQGSEDFEEKAAFLAKYGPRLAQGDPEALYDMLKEAEKRHVDLAQEVATGVWNQGWETLTAKQQKELAGYNAFFNDPSNKDIAADKEARAEVERLVNDKNYSPQQAAEAVREKLELKKELKAAKAQNRPAGQQQHYEGNRASAAFGDDDADDPETKTARSRAEEWRKKPPGQRGSESMFSGGPSKWSK
jgi:uncharacterized small protein (DUF1192 family)